MRHGPRRQGLIPWPPVTASACSVSIVNAPKWSVEQHRHQRPPVRHGNVASPDFGPVSTGAAGRSNGCPAGDAARSALKSDRPQGLARGEWGFRGPHRRDREVRRQSEHALSSIGMRCPVQHLMREAGRGCR